MGGDWSTEAIEAFRAAYGQQLATPEEHDVDQRMGLPTENISLTSPWIHHTGLWKAPSGRGPEELKVPFDPNNYFNPPEEEEELSDEEVDEYIDSLTQEELLALGEELGVFDEGYYEEEETVTDDEIDALIDEILNSSDEEG